MLRLFIFFLVSIVHGKRLNDVLWNSTNPIFDISNTDHVIPVHMNDRISFLCPDPGDKYEYSLIHMVSEEEYNHCYVQESSQVVGACDDPSTKQVISITFRKFNPTPNGLEFQPGNTYYFITTSDGTVDGLRRRKGGMCTTKQMKMKFEVDLDEVKSRSHNPKFAARTYDKSESTTPVLYIIHNADEDSTELDDNSSSTFSLSLASLLLTLFIAQFL